MANHISAIKRIRQTERRRVRNRVVRQSTRTAEKKARAVLQSKPAEGAQALRDAISALSKAASKGVIHRNAASRRIARLSKLASKNG